MDNENPIIVRVRNSNKESYLKKLEETLIILEINFPNKKIIKIPAEIPVEFL